ncbi:MAG: phosphoribosyltransferase [Sulfolobales archaeon]
MARIPVKQVSWNDIVEWSRGLARKILESGWIPDVVIAIARGGYVPARLICDFLGVENLLSLQSQHWTEAAKASERAIIKFPYTVDLRGLKALLVDDIVDTGESLLLAREYVQKNWKPEELRIAALQWISSVAKFKPDYYHIEVREWIWFQYPWTRVEDLSQFISRIIKENSSKSLWNLEEIISSFKEWYGYIPDDLYLEEALNMLERKKILEKINERTYRSLYKS